MGGSCPQAGRPNTDSLTPGPFCDVVADRHRHVQFSQQAGKCQGEKADKTSPSESMQVIYLKGLTQFFSSESRCRHASAPAFAYRFTVPAWFIHHAPLFAQQTSHAYPPRLMNGPATPSPMVAFGLAIVGLQGLLWPNVCDGLTVKATDPNWTFAAKSDPAVIAHDDSTSRSVLPTGWRRTTRGWERAEAWVNGDPASSRESIGTHAYGNRFSALGGMQPQTVSQWMLWDQAREPVWANTLMNTVKRVHPLFVAVFLIFAAVLITRLSEPSALQPPVERSSE